MDADPQGDLTTSLGWAETDDLPVTLATQMEKIIHDAVPSGEALCGASQVIDVQRSAE